MHFLRPADYSNQVLALVSRESEATSNLSAILTLSGLVTMFVVQRLGLALGDIDARGGWSRASKIDYDAPEKATVKAE